MPAPIDSRQALADWAMLCDMDEAQFQAMRACSLIAGAGSLALEFAGFPLMSWGPATEMSPVRGLARVALARRMVRAWASDLLWEDDPDAKLALRHASLAFSQVARSQFEQAFWMDSLKAAGAIAKFGEPGARLLAALRRGPGASHARQALSAELLLHVEEGSEVREAARVLAAIESRSLSDGLGRPTADPGHGVGGPERPDEAGPPEAGSGDSGSSSRGRL